MNEEIVSGFSLLVIGMVTVLTILTLVVISGNVLILLVNKYFPGRHGANDTASTSLIDNKILSVIISAVEIVTRGKGKVKQVKKINHR